MINPNAPIRLYQIVAALAFGAFLAAAFAIAILSLIAMKAGWL